MSSLPRRSRAPGRPVASGPSVELLGEVLAGLRRMAVRERIQPRAVPGAAGPARVRRYVLEVGR